MNFISPAHLSALNEGKRQTKSANIQTYTLVTLWNSGIDVIGVIPREILSHKNVLPVAFWMALCWVAINDRKATKFIPNLYCIHIYNIWTWWGKVSLADRRISAFNSKMSTSRGWRKSSLSLTWRIESIRRCHPGWFMISVSTLTLEI